MDFTLTEEDELIVATTESFAGGLRQSARSFESAGAVDEATTRAFDALGLSALGESGSGTGALSFALAVEQLAWGDGATTFALLASTAAARFVEALGAEGPVDRATGVDRLDALPGWLPMAPGDRLLTFDERGRWQRVQVGGEPIDALGLSAAGSVQPTVGDVEARGEASPEQLAGARGWMWLFGAAIAVGVARASLEYASDYVQEREAFGKPLAQHQGLAFIVAEMAMRTEAARQLLRRAAHRLDEGEPAECTAAWLEAVEASLWVTDQGVQLLGGHGYMQAHPVEKWMRDVRALSLCWGGAERAARVWGEDTFAAEASAWT